MNGAACITFIVRAAIVRRDAWYRMPTCTMGGCVGMRVSDRVLRPLLITYGLLFAACFSVCCHAD